MGELFDDIEDAEIIAATNALEATKREYEDIADIYNEDDETLTQLIEAERILKEQWDANRRKQQEIKDKRYQRRVEMEDKKRAMQEAETKYEEAIRFKRLEEQRAESFIRMVEEARNANYAWVDKALPHQWEGAMTIAHYGSVIESDDTGLGKTMTCVMSADLSGHKKILVLTPNDVVSGFATEFQRWAPHRSLIPIEGANPQMRKMVKTVIDNSNEFVVLVNYESLWRDFSWLANVEWDVIFIDEAHNMKNETGMTFYAVDNLKYKTCVPVTATTILNSPGDLFALLHMLEPNRFYDKRMFLQSYCMQNGENKWVFRPGGEKALMASLKGRIIKRSYEDAGIVLPKQHVNEVVIPKSALSENQRTIMKQLNEFAAIQLDTGEGINITAMIALITRERQAAVFPAGIEIKQTERMYQDAIEMGMEMVPPVGTVLFKVPDNVPSIKLDMAEDKLDRMVKSGRRCVVFSQFKTALVDLERRLNARGVKVVRYDGDTNKNTRLEVKRDFLRPASGERKSEYKYDVVLANYKTGGVGLTFTDATYMLCLDEEWNPAKNHQARARIHRIGQTEETTVDILRIEGSIDMWMKTVNEVKQAIVNGFESEIDIAESLKQYLNIQKEIPAEPEQKAITVKPEPDDEFLALLDGLDLD